MLEMVQLATRTALEDDPSLADQVAALECEVDEMEHRVVQQVLLIMALQGPVAYDLLRLAAAFAIISELEKMGDEAKKLALRVCKLQGEFPFALRELLQEISHQAQANIHEGLRLYSSFDAEAAERLIAMDDAVDQTYKTSRNAILAMMSEHPENARQLLRCAEIFHALEHVSDHTVDMAKRLRECHARLGRPARE